jgi:hypothetical protein
MWAAKSTAVGVAKILIYFLKFCYVIIESESVCIEGTRNHRAYIFKEMNSEECQDIYVLVLVWCARVSSVNMSCMKKAIKWPSSLPDIVFCSSHCVTIVFDVRWQWVDRKRENSRQSLFFFLQEFKYYFFLRKITDISRQELCCMWRNVIWRCRGKLDCRLLVDVGFVQMKLLWWQLCSGQE